MKPFKWNICGEGLQLEELKENIKKLNLSDNVFLVGKINGNLKQKFLESSDVFVMPSYKVNNSIEGFGILILKQLLINSINCRLRWGSNRCRN